MFIFEYRLGCFSQVSQDALCWGMQNPGWASLGVPPLQPQPVTGPLGGLGPLGPLLLLLAPEALGSTSTGPAIIFQPTSCPSAAQLEYRMAVVAVSGGSASLWSKKRLSAFTLFNTLPPYPAALFRYSKALEHLVVRTTSCQLLLLGFWLNLLALSFPVLLWSPVSHCLPPPHAYKPCSLQCWIILLYCCEHYSLLGSLSGFCAWPASWVLDLWASLLDISTVALLFDLLVTDSDTDCVAFQFLTQGASSCTAVAPCPVADAFYQQCCCSKAKACSGLFEHGPLCQDGGQQIWHVAQLWPGSTSSILPG